MRWLRGWRLLAVAALALPAVSVVTLLGWLHSDADLRAVEAEALQRGIVTRWSDVERDVSDAATLARWERILRLSQGLPSYRKSVGVLAEKLVIGEPPPPRMKLHHAAFDVATIGELIALIDRLDGRCIRHPLVKGRPTDQVSLSISDLSEMLGERLALAHRDDVAGEMRRFLKLATVYELIDMTNAVRSVAVQVKALRALAYRLSDIVESGDRSLLLELTRIGDAGFDVGDATAGEYRSTMNLWRSLPLLGLLMDKWDAPSSWLAFVDSRRLRSRVLREQLDWHVQLAGSASLVDFHRRAYGLSTSLRDADEGGRSWIINSAEMHRAYADAMVRTHLMARLLCAEIAHEPWPGDPWSSAGGPLLRISRDGRVIASYSIGSDGVDDGGDRDKDEVFELYGTVAAPKPTP
ncbi:MAG TPA: hypothetical protein VEL07_15190 [Planctomycetota bacterium]|nr:hypothetical protein [Planctomycetota bacterium]